MLGDDHPDKERDGRMMKEGERTPLDLIEAATNNDTETVRALIENGSFVDDIDYIGHTAAA